MKFYSLSQKTTSKVCRELEKGQGRPEFVACTAFTVTCSSLQRPAFSVFLFICMLLFELYYSVEDSALQFFTTNIMPYSLSQPSPEQITMVCKYKQNTR